jgi:L-malate glycosyltransferase
MKICILAIRYLPTVGGVQLVTYHMAKELSRAGHEVHIITVREVSENRGNFSGTSSDNNGSDNVHVHYLNLPFQKIADKKLIIRCLLFIVPAFLMIRRIRPHLVQAQNTYSSIPAFLSKWFFQVPYAIGMHGEKYWETGEIFLPLCLKKIWPLLPWIKESDAIFTLTDNTRVEIQRYLKKNPVVIPNGVDLDLFRPDPKKLLSLNTIPHIVCISRLYPGKGIECALRAMKLLVERYPDAKLVIIGDGIFWKNLEELTRDLDLGKNVEFIGEVPVASIPAYLSPATIYLLPSFAEGFSISLLEAMASGLPVISTPVGIAPRICTEWNNGFIVPINDPEAIYEAVIKITENPEIRSMFSKNSLENAKNYSWSTIIKQYEAEYSKIVAHPPGNTQ